MPSNTDPFERPDGAHREEGGVKRNRWGQYLIPDPENGVEIAWTRATSFAKILSKTDALRKWGERMVAKGLMKRQDLQLLAASTSLEDRRRWEQITDQAKTAAGADEAANHGTALHSFTEASDKGEGDDIPRPWDARVRAYHAALEAHGITVVPDMIERVVIIRRFFVAGTFDRIVRMPDGDLWIADLKTARDLKYSKNEIAVQLALYAHADAIFNPSDGTFEEMPKVNQDKALVIHLPVVGDRCDLYRVNIEFGWRAAELAEKVRNWQRFSDLFDLIGSASVETDSEGETTTLADQIRQAATVEELTAIWITASRKGEWTQALEQLGLQRKEEIEG